MARKRVGSSRTSRCELSSSPPKRRTADKLAASVKDTLPAGLAQPALRALARAGYQNLDQLAKVSESDLLELHGMGPGALRIIREALRRQGKTLGR